jgi:hypothetical protein
MPTTNLTDDELPAVAAATRRAAEDDKFPHAPRLDPLRSALAKLGPATARARGNRRPRATRDGKSEPAAK